MEHMSVSDLFTLLGACVLVGIGFILYDTWRGVKSSNDDADDYDNREEGGEEPQPQPKAAPPPIAATAPVTLRPIAITRNERNEDLPRNERNERLRVQADIIARLTQAKSIYIADGKGGYKLIGQTALITLATGLAANGRPDSEYGQLRAELDPLLRPQIAVAAGQPHEHLIAK
jgi:hypothetical protein